MDDNGGCSHAASHAVPQHFHCQQHEGNVGGKDIVPILPGPTKMSCSQVNSKKQGNHAEDIYNDK